MLSTKFKTHFTLGNLNNHIGVPLTLLSMPMDTEIAVVEMGANHPHEISDLCKIAEPNFGIITNIGKAHLEGFGSLQGVINTKRELYDYIADHGKLIFADDDNTLLLEVGKNLERVTYGKNKNADYQAQLLSSEPFIEILFQGDIIETNLLGNYNFTNVLAAIAIGSYFGINKDELKKAISSYQPSNKRSQLLETAKNKIYLDAYNANPTSMRNAIESFASINISPKIAIIGDMLELGNESKAEHLEIVNLLNSTDFENIIFVGPEFSSAAKDTKFPRFSNSQLASEYLSKINLQGKFILVKGSRGICLEKTLEWL